MFKRTLPAPDASFFLFGPRGTGKTTWLNQVFPNAVRYDFLRAQERVRLSRDPSLLRREIEATQGGWIILDEIQRVPDLLDEVHSIIADHGSRFRFALCGSSARKLKRLGGNMLAGRAINRQFFPLTAEETEYAFSPERMLSFGMLPRVVSEPDMAIDILDAYASNYIEQEIMQEALVRDLGSFSRFLGVAAHLNARITNLANVSREAAVARPTVQRYFDVLVSTLIAEWVPAWQPRQRVKETAHPKLYFFDTGVVRAICGRLRDSLHDEEKGFLLETLVLHELRAYRNRSNTGGDFSYWATPSGGEIDFIWTRGKNAVGIEVKASASWRSGYSNSMRDFLEHGTLKRAFGVYLGDRTLKEGPIEVLPLNNFLRKLAEGSIIG